MTEGSGLFETPKLGKSELIKGSAILLPPKAPHYYGGDRETGMNELYVTFNGAVFDLMRDVLEWDSLPPLVNFSAETAAIVEKVFETFANGASIDPHEALLMVQRLVGLHVSCAKRLSLKPEVGTFLERACLMLGDPDKSLRDIAAKLGCSYSHFRRRFKAESGRSPNQFRMLQKLEKAGNLLINTNLSHARIAEECQFCDEFYLSRAFKNYSGRSPREFRRSFQIVAEARK